MRERWLRTGLLAGGLFAIVVAGRLAARLWFEQDFVAWHRTVLATLGAVGLVTAVLAIVWGRVRPAGVVVSDIAGAAVAAGVLHLAVGPFVSGVTPAEVGAGDSFNAAWQLASAVAVGVLVGYLLLMMVGKDYKSQSLKRFAQARLTKPPRPVRR